MRQISEQTGICFFRVGSASRLLPFLLESDFSPLRVDESTLRWWLDFGCIYVDGLRIRCSDLELRPNQIVRAHTRPKRYPTTEGQLQRHIVMDHDEFLVLDKPAGLPTHPTLDNYHENAKALLERELGIPLFTTHRLDIPTQGLLVIAKTKAAQALWNKMFSLRRVTKIYRSLNAAPCALGLHVHYMDPQSRVPKILSRDASPNWVECRFHVLTSVSTSLGYAHQLQLLTGRTHQIRAQMADLGAPILGDQIYGAGLPKQEFHERLALECFELSFTFRSGTFRVFRPLSLVPLICTMASDAAPQS